ncbi:MAG: metallothionein [Candidatus Latescibacterota bacterium]|nr:MAG: metallothionein [Candidatus Latescibacterota bacterium]
MKCDCKSCNCEISADNRYDYEGKVYCSEQCAKECTDETCVCTPCDCSKHE